MLNQLVLLLGAIPNVHVASDPADPSSAAHVDDRPGLHAPDGLGDGPTTLLHVGGGGFLLAAVDGDGLLLELRDPNAALLWVGRVNGDRWTAHRVVDPIAPFVVASTSVTVVFDTKIPEWKLQTAQKKMQSALISLANLVPPGTDYCAILTDPACKFTIKVFDVTGDGVGEWNQKDPKAINLDVDFLVKVGVTGQMIASVIVHEIEHKLYWDSNPPEKRKDEEKFEIQSEIHALSKQIDYVNGLVTLLKAKKAAEPDPQLKAGYCRLIELLERFVELLEMKKKVERQKLDVDETEGSLSQPVAPGAGITQPGSTPTVGKDATSAL